MKKQKASKLTLNKETVQKLSDRQLAVVAGGVSFEFGMCSGGGCASEGSICTD